MKNTLETRLGIFFALALVVAVVILEMIGAADFLRRGFEISTNFKTAQDLKRGDFVKIAGVEVGRVEGVELRDSLAHVTMKIQGKYSNAIPVDAQAVVKFTGLMGQNFVAIEGGTPGAPRIGAGGALSSREQPDLSAIMVKLENVASGVEGLTKSFSAESFSTLLGPLTDFLKQNTNNFTQILSNTRLITEQVAQGRGTMGRLINDETLYNSALTTVAALQSAANQADVIVKRTDGLLQRTDSLVASARVVIDNINAGQGTLGRLTKDETLYLQTTNAMGNLAEILQKMNRGQGTVGKLINDDSFYKNAKLSLQKLEKATEGLEDQGPLSVLGIAVNSLF